MRIVPRHQSGSYEGVSEFVDPLVKSPSGFTDIHQKVFPPRADAIEAGFFGNDTEFFFTGSEGYPRGPG